MATVDFSTTVNRAILYSEPGTIKTHIAELPVEKPGFGQVLVRILYSGVCHTDYGFCTNSWTDTVPPTAKDQIGGHEGVGEVVALGPEVSEPPIGAKVGIKFASDACLNCERCLEGGETSCLAGKVSGFYTAGTFQQYCIAPAHYVTPIPDGIDLAGAAPLMCGGITVYAALKRSNFANGQWISIVGAGGGLGHLAIQYAKALGGRVLAIDAASKEDFCLGFGADAFIDFTKLDDEGLVAEVHKITNGGAKVILMLSSSNRAYAQAVKCLRFRGILWCIGVPEGKAVPIAGALPIDLMGLEATLTALKAGNRKEAKECLEIAGRGLVKCHYELRPMDSLTDIFREMEEGKVSGRMVIDLR